MFVLAEPEDMVIICGEFNSGVEIINESWEPEQVFTVTKIIQHPDYKPTTVRQQKSLLSSLLSHGFAQADVGANGGGPIDGNDIAVYHVIQKDGFKLGQNVNVRITNNVAEQPVEKSSQDYIWPACLPKDDSDVNFENEITRSHIHPNNRINMVHAMMAGWLDAPPISQAFSNLLGSALTEADVLQ